MFPILLGCLLAAAPRPAISEESTAVTPVVTRSRQMMGTQVTIVVAAPESEKLDAALSSAWDEFDRVEQVMNEWRPDSPLSRINAAAGSGRFVDAPADLCEVLKTSLAAAGWTHRLFDPTWAALRDVWTFDERRERASAPSKEDVARVCPLVNFRDVSIRTKKPTGCAVRLERKGMKLGLGGVAKGWAVDRAVAALRAGGFRDFIVQAGGDLFASGRRGDRPWRVGIREPRGAANEFFADLDVEDAAFSTSGDYERYFVVDGRRYHHIIDPRTCWPAENTRSATVLAKSALEAEFLTKATFILGGDEALALAANRNAAAVLVTADNRVLISPSLEKRANVRPPRP